MSDLVKQIYINDLGFSEENIIILPNAVNLPEEDITLSKPDKIIYLFLGELCERKGAFELIEAIGSLKSELNSKRFQLLMAGNGDIKKAEHLISKYGLEDLIQLPGWITSTKKIHYYNHILFLFFLHILKDCQWRCWKP